MKLHKKSSQLKYAFWKLSFWARAQKVGQILMLVTLWLVTLSFMAIQVVFTGFLIFLLLVEMVQDLKYVNVLPEVLQFSVMKGMLWQQYIQQHFWNVQAKILLLLLFPFTLLVMIPMIIITHLLRWGRSILKLGAAQSLEHVENIHQEMRAIEECEILDKEIACISTESKSIKSRPRL